MSEAERATPRRFPAWWAWTFPLTYAAHLGEELWAGEGFPAWIERVAGVGLTPGRFVALNAFGLLMTLGGVALALRDRRMEWILTSMATAVLLNAASHAAASLATASYSPGLATGIALWVPLGVWTLARARRTTAPKPFARAVAVGVAAHAVVLVSLAVQSGV
jgi:hypothetical protein